MPQAETSYYACGKLRSTNSSMAISTPSVATSVATPKTAYHGAQHEEVRSPSRKLEDSHSDMLITDMDEAMAIEAAKVYLEELRIREEWSFAQSAKIMGECVARRTFSKSGNLRQ
jgi:hypothetical protein